MASIMMTRAQTAMDIMVDWRMLPMPTIGEITPPNRKPIEPNIAEALPTYARPSDMAMVVEAVNR